MAGNVYFLPFFPPYGTDTLEWRINNIICSLATNVRIQNIVWVQVFQDYFDTASERNCLFLSPLKPS